MARETHYTHITSYGCAAPTFGRRCLAHEGCADPAESRCHPACSVPSFARLARELFVQNPLALGVFGVLHAGCFASRW